ncbi:MAG: TIM barrel protein, partial [Kiritimatiellia bacterium]
MYISIFTDELKLDVKEAIPVIRSWGLDCIDFRGMVFGKEIHDLDDSELRDLKKLVDENGMAVGCLQTSLCKAHLPDAERQQAEAKKLEGIIRAADALDCRLVRSFSYWQPSGDEARRLHTHPEASDAVMALNAPI